MRTNFLFFFTLSLEKLQTSNSDQGAGPREAPPDPPSSTDRTKLKGQSSVCSEFGWGVGGGVNVSCLFVSCQYDFGPFVSCQLSSC